MLSLYLHFPFCKRKCAYCDFCSFPADEGEIGAYCAALQKEIILASEPFAGTPVATVFLGGGTPSLIPAEAMARVLATLRERFDLLPDAEFTSEANPGTLTDSWLDTLRAAGANRLSLGVQAGQERLLRMLGRIHDFPAAVEAVATARRHGFTNLSTDAMFGLPGQTRQDYLDTLDALTALDVRHISAYSLILEEGTPLYNRVKHGELALPGEDETADMMEAGIDFLEARGYRRYEISNFARPGYECRHNLGCWRLQPYLGLGLNAASLLPAGKADGDAAYVRRTNTADIKEYLQKLEQNELPIAERKPVPVKEAMFEAIMLGLRTVDGVSYAAFARRFGVTLTDAYGPAVRRLTAQGLLQPAAETEPRLALTRRGLALQNTALMAFMDGPTG